MEGEKMLDRRQCLRRGILVGAALCAPECIALASQTQGKPEVSFKTQTPVRALVAWYSPTGNTRRYALLAGKCLEKLGLHADVMEYRDIPVESLPGYDLILIGCPVHNWDIPVNIQQWLRKIPAINGAAVGAFVSYGGPEGNQHNAACSALELLAAKKGLVVGMGEFMNMGTFPTPNWDYKGQREHSHLPNQQTFEEVRRFVASCVANTRNGLSLTVNKNCNFREMLKLLPSIALTKMLIDRHEIDTSKCIRCNACARNCPAGAIGPEKNAVDRKACLLCFGCFNTCPVQAVKMNFRKQELYGYQEFLRRNAIVTMEPDALRM
jgi:ferredoxin/flavodoxin